MTPVSNGLPVLRMPPPDAAAAASPAAIAAAVIASLGVCCEAEESER